MLHYIPSLGVGRGESKLPSHIRLGTRLTISHARDTSYNCWCLLPLRTACVRVYVRGWYKTWTLDSGLDYGLEYGPKNGLDYGLKTDSRRRAAARTSKNQPATTLQSHYICSRPTYWWAGPIVTLRFL